MESAEIGMHKRLAMDIIKRQAGTLEKALLEGVMNAVDAKAKRCDLTIKADCVVIEDNGNGLPDDEKQLKKVFGTLGQPPEKGEKKVYGYFRMGRGQIFAQGRNEWWSGVWHIIVDVNEMGLGYQYERLAPKKGCRIEVGLYRKLMPSELNRVIRAIEKMAKYTEMFGTKLYVNGKRVSKDPSKEKWDEVTDDAYIRFTESGSLTVYNLGVAVMDESSYRYGYGGVVVARKQLKVNFARNDVMSDCPVWKKSRRTLDKLSGKKIKNKKVLSDSERQRLRDCVVSGEIKGDEAANAPIFTDVAGRNWSAKRINLWSRGNKLTFAPSGDRLGDMLHRQKVAFVMASKMKTALGMSDKKILNLIKKLRDTYEVNDAKVVSFAELTKGMDKSMMILPEDQWSLDERIWRSLLATAGWDLASMNGSGWGWRDKQRDILIGDSKCAKAWTDGTSYVAFSRQYLKRHKLDVKGIFDVMTVLLHEYCHTENDTQSHAHSQEFFELFHDNVWRVTETAWTAFSNLEKVFGQEGKKWGAVQLRVQDRLMKQQRAHEHREKKVAEVEAKVGRKLEPRQTKPPRGAKRKPRVGPNPYAKGTLRDLFEEGSGKFQDLQDLIAVCARKTDKTEKQVRAAYYIIKNSNHKSNMGSKVEEKGGKVRLVRIGA